MNNLGAWRQIPKSYLCMHTYNSLHFKDDDNAVLSETDMDNSMTFILIICADITFKAPTIGCVEDLCGSCPKGIVGKIVNIQNSP